MGSRKFINHEMYYLVNMDHNGMATHLTTNDCEGHDGDSDTDW